MKVQVNVVLSNALKLLNLQLKGFIIEGMNIEERVIGATKLWESLNTEVEKRIIGQKEVIKRIVITLLCEGHSIITGVPGLAKTRIIKTLSEILDLEFSRIQFTPDLMPSDIIGTEILDTDGSGKRFFKFVKGPVFANLILADEVNRTPPKTQSALLEAMQERKVTVQGKTYKLPRPFSVIATQNPIEQEGTYPLPEAQLDRFMLEIIIDYPDFNEEVRVVSMTTTHEEENPRRLVTKEEIVEYQKLVLSLPIGEHAISYAVNIARETRPEYSHVKEVKDYVLFGAGPRASQYLVLGAKALSLLYGKPIATTKEINEIAEDVLRHRLILNYKAGAEGIRKEYIINKVLEYVQRRI